LPGSQDAGDRAELKSALAWLLVAADDGIVRVPGTAVTWVRR
jgi:hypothetical protein